MCGLTGFLDNSLSLDDAALRACVQRMAVQMALRGPDDCGEWTDAASGIALGFRRLSIIDLSPAGHQPMASASGRYVIAYNGEVYNFASLRRELEREGKAPAFRGGSDTEVMLACMEEWGIAAAVRRFIGMFAIALWDQKDGALHLIRDRLGVKPLYYGGFGDCVVFGSELKPLRAHPQFRGEINRDAIALFLRHSYIPAPYSIYRNVFKLAPGTILSIPRGVETLPRPVPYWSVREAVERGAECPFTGSEEEAIDRLDALLKDAVGLRTIADVPLGVFLSGGIDSSTVTALMQAQSTSAVKTFCIGFREEVYDEARYARAIAGHLGTEHTEMIVAPEQALAVIPKLPRLFDEPFADSSQVPMFLVSELARGSVTVSLSGDGGDEVFGGYNRYFQGRSLWNALKRVPSPVRGAVGGVMAASPPGMMDAAYRMCEPALPKRFRQRLPSEKIGKMSALLGAASPDALYRGLVSHWNRPETIVRNGREQPTPLTTPESCPRQSDFTERMMYLDSVMYLPDDILVKVDRASMGVSLEAREPLLDHRILEFAWTLPLSMKVRDGEGKWILRQVLNRYVPSGLVDRPKMGFGVPIDEWLRGPLRDWAEALLDTERLRREDLFEPAPIRQKWEEHIARKRNWHHHLWDILMFQAWLESQTSRMSGG